MPIRARDLLQILASIQRVDTTEPIYCEYTRTDHNGSALFRVESNIPYGVIRAESDDADEFYEYNRSTRVFILRDGKEKHQEADRPFPASPPVLALLSPIDFPIWGGEASFYQPTQTESLDHTHVKVTFGHPTEEAEFGYVVLDLETGTASELEINDVRYERNVAK